ncbi:MAG TPA: hypothetical protein VMU54_04620 [Planctomycetota bacterium]|nr:hypothetical protein [Planctomycetota bacterium]
MLLDAKHKPWIAAVAVSTLLGAGAYVPYHLLSLNGPSGGSWPGLAFGIIAFFLMGFVGLLGLRRRFPALRVGRPETWMRGHLWLGLLTVPYVFFHAGFMFGGTLTIVLMVLLILVTLSGILGVILQQILPRVMTSRVTMETIYDQLEHVLAQLLAEADLLVSSVAGPVLPTGSPVPATVGAAAGASAPAAMTRKETRIEGSLPMRDFYLNQVRPFLESRKCSGPLANAQRAAAAFSPIRTLVPPSVHEALKDLEGICEERRQLATQERLHHWLHGWLLVHIPLSYALLLLSFVHGVVSVRY